MARASLLPKLTRPLCDTLLFLSVLGLAALIPSAAAAGQAYLWANQASAGNTYSPPSLYSYNSSGATNQIRRISTGRYQLILPGVGNGSGGGNVQVTAYGDTTSRCKVGSWSGWTSTVYVDVRCFTRYGTPVDHRFTALFAKYPQHGVASGFIGYAWSNTTGISNWHTPSSYYQFNSHGGAIRVRSQRIGRYEIEVTSPGHRMLSPIVIVTAYGSQATNCDIYDKWGGDSLGIWSFEVSCRDSAGLAPSAFSVSLVEQTTSVPGQAGGGVAALYNPNFNTTGVPSSRETHDEEGLMTVTLPGIRPGGVAIANSGVHSLYCTVIGWSWSASESATKVDVRCRRDWDHSPQSTDFDLQFLANGRDGWEWTPPTFPLPPPFPDAISW